MIVSRVFTSVSVFTMVPKVSVDPENVVPLMARDPLETTIEPERKVRLLLLVST